MPQITAHSRSPIGQTEGRDWRISDRPASSGLALIAASPTGGFDRHDRGDVDHAELATLVVGIGVEANGLLAADRTGS